MDGFIVFARLRQYAPPLAFAPYSSVSCKVTLNRPTSTANMSGHLPSAILVFGRPFVKRFVLCYWTVVLSCLSVLSVTLVYCGQTVGWIKMKLGMEVGLGLGHIVLDGTRSPSRKGHSPLPCFRPISVEDKFLSLTFQNIGPAPFPGRRS